MLWYFYLRILPLTPHYMAKGLSAQINSMKVAKLSPKEKKLKKQEKKAAKNR